MSANVKQFNATLESFSTSIGPAKFDRLMKKTAFKLLSAYIDATPVDTGRARANWQVGINNYNESEKQVGFTRKHAGGESAEDKEQAATLFVGLTEAPKINSSPAGSTIYLFNNVPYIEVLNEPRRESFGARTGKLAKHKGHSIQTEPYWFQRQFQAIVAFVKREIAKIGLGSAK